MVRQHPFRHKVKTHERNGAVVHSYTRGNGSKHLHKSRRTIVIKTPYNSLRKVLRSTIHGFKIYSVNGAFVRGNYDISFTMGNHPYTGDKYIPASEIWIDDNLSPYDFGALTVHEITEAQRMRDLHEPYEVAHFAANKAELKWREKQSKKYRVLKIYDSIRAKDVGKFVGIDWEHSKFSPRELAKGLNVELEHGSRDSQTDVTHGDPFDTAKIAWKHLKERPDYYEMLKKVEN
jgi:hypothetical protein